MTARRARLVAAVVAALSALSMGPAHAAGTARITTPATGATLTSSTAIAIQVTGDNGTMFEPRDHEVLVRLADHTGATAYAGTRQVAATCRTDCHTDSTWTVASFDPATLAPFAAGPSCNGGYTVQARVDGGPWSGNAIRIARAPGAPRDVSVSAGVREATITWGAAPDPDVVGYTVDRRRDGGAWKQVAGVAPGTRSVTDADVAAGEVEYRVVTLRGDGLTAGGHAAPCTDDEPDLATPSAPVGTTVRAPSSASPSPSDSPTNSPSPDASPDGDGDVDGRTGGSDGGDGDGTTDGNGTAGGSDGGSDGDGTTTPEDRDATDGNGGADGDGSGDDPDGTETPSRRAGSRVAPPSRMDTGAAPDVDVPDGASPDGPQVASEEERFYGEGQAYSEELDFGDLGEVDALGEGPATTRVVRVPGALQSVLGEQFALERVVAPVAAGMIMLAFGLHLRRWTREGLEQE